MHKWTWNDDLIKDIKQISLKLGMSHDSLIMRIVNFKATATGSGLAHVANAKCKTDKPESG